MITDPLSSEAPKPRTVLSSKKLGWPGCFVAGIGCGLGSAIAVGSVGGYYWGLPQLQPLVEKGLNGFLNRPVTLGPIKRFSLTHLEFGPTTLGSTATDPSWVKLQGLVIRYNPLAYLWKHQLGLDITAIAPQAYLVQNPTGAWLATPVDEVQENFPLTLNALRIRNAQGVLVPHTFPSRRPHRPVTLHLTSATVKPHQERLVFDLDGQLSPQTHPQGRLTLRGNFNPDGKRLNITLQSQNTPLVPLRELLPFPLDLQGGTVQGQVAIAVEREELTDLAGRLTLTEGSLKLPGLARSVTQVQGPLNFQGQTIEFGNLQARLGTIQGQVTGSLDWRNGFNLAIATQPLAIPGIFHALQFPRPVIPLQGQLAANVQVTGPLDHPQIRINVAQAGKDPLRVDRLALHQGNAELHITPQTVEIRQVRGRADNGGQIVGSGSINVANQALQMTFLAQGIDSRPWLPDTLPDLPSLPLTGKTEITGLLTQPAQWRVQGQFAVPLLGGAIQGQNVMYHRGRWQGDVNFQQVPLQPFALSLPSTLADLTENGRLSAQLHLQGDQNQANPFQSLTAHGQGHLNLPHGRVTFPQFSVNQGQWQAAIAGSVSPQVLGNPQLPGQVQANLQAQGLWDQGNFSNGLKVVGRGQWQVGDRALQLRALVWTPHQWQGQLHTPAFPLDVLVPEQALGGTIAGQVQFNSAGLAEPWQWQWTGTGEWRPPLRPGSVIPNLSQSRVRLTQGTLNQGQFQARLVTRGIPWRALNLDQGGLVAGRLTLGGQWAETGPQLQRVGGTLTSDHGWQKFTNPLTGRFDWQGDRLTVQTLESRGLKVTGLVQLPLNQVQPRRDILPLVKALNLAVNAQDLALASFLPPKIPLQGQATFQGRITGPGLAPHTQGTLAIAGLTLGNYAIGESITGTLDHNPQGLKLDLQGPKTQVQLALDSRYQPHQFTVHHQDLFLQGDRQKEDLWITARNVPLPTLQATLPLALENIPELTLAPWITQPVGGTLSGQFTWNPSTHHFTGHGVSLQRPQWGSFRAQDITANFTAQPNHVTVTSGRIRYGQSTILVQGQGNFGPQSPQWNGQVTLRDSRIEDLLAMAQVFEWQDFQRGLQAPRYGTAQDLYGDSPAEDQDHDPGDRPLITVGNGALSLQEQFNLLSAAKAQGQSGPATPSPLPPLEALTGRVEGKITLQQQGKNSPAASVSLQGQQWQWGNYALDQLTLAGEWQGENISLQPLELRSGDRFVRLTGNLTPTHQQGRLELHRLPLTPLVNLGQFPPHLRPQGEVFASLDFGGTRADPEFQGEIRIPQGRFASGLITATQGQFAYHTGRLNFTLESRVPTTTDPITLTGTLPYVFPFAQQTPASDEFSLALRLNQDSFALLNALSNQQITWLAGQGEAQIDLWGRLNPRTQTLFPLYGRGSLTFHQGAIATPFLPDNPVTEINGQIIADLHQLQVVNLTGQISGGSLALQGSLPLRHPLPQSDLPLQLTFHNLALALPKLYQGALNGQVTVNGTAQAPQLGGQLTLSDGKILLGNLPTPNDSPNDPQPLEFKDLTLTLGDNIRIQNLPFLDFAARGHLNLGGSLAQIQPQGEITLQGGQVNLFASQLRLDSRQANTVSFGANRGLDPYLDLHLVSAASETRRQAQRHSLSSEIDEPFRATQESLQTVRIQAQITGPASELNDRIRLTSTPQRSEAEIITLLGGGFINPLGQDDPQTTVGLANLAGSAVLGTVQGQIGEALGLSEFRIFSAPLVNEEDRRPGQDIGVVAEAGIDLTPQWGLSVQKILNIDRPPQWGVQYRLNDHTLIRGSSNFQDDSRGVIEFQQRF